MPVVFPERPSSGNQVCSFFTAYLAPADLRKRLAEQKRLAEELIQLRTPVEHLVAESGIANGEIKRWS
jgi:hypothetical protein